MLRFGVAQYNAGASSAQGLVRGLRFRLKKNTLTGAAPAGYDRHVTAACTGGEGEDHAMKKPLSIATALQEAREFDPELGHRLQAVAGWLDARQIQQLTNAWRLQPRLFDRMMQGLTSRARAEQLEWRKLFQLLCTWNSSRELFDLLWHRVDKLDYMQIFMLRRLWKVDQDLFWSQIDTGADFVQIYKVLKAFCMLDPQGRGWVKRDLGRMQ